MLTPLEAENTIREALARFPRADCSLAAAHGRILRGDLVADRDLPPFDRVTLDGYALRAAAVENGIRRFRVSAVQAAGMRPLTIEADDTCVEIMTGAVLPAGADAVVPYERVERDGEAMTLKDGVTVPPDSAVHRRGSDHRAGEPIVAAGVRITGREIAIAAAVGASTLTVAALPRIALIASGDELVDVDSPVAAHQIRRSNDHALRAALITGGYPQVEQFHLRDVRHEVDLALRRILSEHDVVLITGGVSKGKFDFLPAALEAQKVRKLLHGVAQRPGKPFWFGVSQRQAPVFALPGNPVSAYTCLHRYVLPALNHASGLRPPGIRLVALAAAAPTAPGLTCFVPVQLSSGPRAELLAHPCAPNTSGDLAGLAGTDGFVELPAGASCPAGYVARFFAW